MNCRFITDREISKRSMWVMKGGYPLIQGGSHPNPETETVYRVPTNEKWNRKRNTN